ncbi:MAG: hypothetical protein HC905_31970 [Bacteroidales bacterium]|nr:hypothetical protein [Bacteroidales bacterium]
MKKCLLSLSVLVAAVLASFAQPSAIESFNYTPEEELQFQGDDENGWFSSWDVSADGVAVTTSVLVSDQNLSDIDDGNAAVIVPVDEGQYSAISRKLTQTYNDSSTNYWISLACLVNEKVGDTWAGMAVNLNGTEKIWIGIPYTTGKFGVVFEGINYLTDINDDEEEIWMVLKLVMNGTAEADSFYLLQTLILMLNPDMTTLLLWEKLMP